MKLLTDITPLRESPAFRRLWIGTMLSNVGTAMTSFANTLQVWDATHSTAATGAIAVASLIPLLVIALPGGSLADTVDRRKLVLVMTACSTVVSALFFVNALLTGTAVGWIWVVYALVAVASAIGAVNQPARQTFIRALVPGDQLPAAMALNRIAFQTMLIAGPALAGVVSGAFGVKGCYLIDVLSFAGSFYGVGRMPAQPPSDRGDSPSRSQLSLLREGLGYIGRNRILAGAFIADVNATFFALPVSLFPAINTERFGGDPRTLGLFTAAIGAGGMVTAVCAGPVRKWTRHGVAMLVAVSVWGAGFAVFAVAPSLWLTLLALAVAGGADTFTVIFRGIIVQRVTPEEFRGRVNAADFVVGAGGGQLGSLESGLVGAVASPEISALAGGLLTIAGAFAIAGALPAFRRYRDTE
ncbi:MAG TPA: MFS transporter [Trebonia sp.]|nr:MFS transporter [Trebonia sp.]